MRAVAARLLLLLPGWWMYWFDNEDKIVETWTFSGMLIASVIWCGILWAWDQTRRPPRTSISEMLARLLIGWWIVGFVVLTVLPVVSAWRFIDDYASVVNAKYTTNEALPSESDEVSLVTDIWFKLTDVPAKYDKMLLQADLYRWTGDGWSEYRVASSDRLVFGKGKLWQHSLSLTAPRGSKWAEEMESKRLPGGKYLVKLYIDQTGKLSEDFRAELGDEEFVGQVEVESQWPVGYGRMTVVAFPTD